MKVKFTKKRYYNKILRQPGDVVVVDDRTGRAYLNAHAAVLIKATKKGHEYYKAGRKRQQIAMPTMDDLSKRYQTPIGGGPEEELEELSEETMVEKTEPIVTDKELEVIVPDPVSVKDEEVPKEIVEEVINPRLHRKPKVVATDLSGKLEVEEPVPLIDLKKDELIAILEKVGLGSKGTKSELIARIERYNEIG